MGLNTLTDHNTGETILAAHPNNIHGAMNGDFVGRNTAGAPTSGQNLGTASVPWGSARITALIIGGSSVDVSQISAPANRVVSGLTRATSNQPAFLDPAGAAGGASFDVTGLSTSLIYDVGGVSNTLSADLTKGSLTTAPGANNTCLIDDADAADQAATRTWGEEGERKNLTIDNAGSEVTDRIGTYAAFSHGNGEILYGLIESATLISHVKRGFAYDSDLDPLNRDVLTNNDTLTLLSTGYVFLEDDETTVDVSYTRPTWSDTEPSGPATGDYWLDLSTGQWKRWSGSAFVVINRTFIGWVFLDDTDCLGARCVHFDARYKQDNDIDLEINSTAVIDGSATGKRVNVAGVDFEYQDGFPIWNMTTNLAATVDLYTAGEQASTYYYLYLADTGVEKISDIEPYEFMGARYHPHNPWRHIGTVFNDGSSDITKLSAESVFNSEIWAHTGNGHGSTNDKIRIWTTLFRDIGTDMEYATSAADGNSMTVQRAGIYSFQTQDRRAGAQAGFGFSLNSTQLTTALGSQTTLTDVMGLGQATTGQVENVNVPSERLLRGDVVRQHTDGAFDDVQVLSGMRARRIA